MAVSVTVNIDAVGIEVYYSTPIDIGTPVAGNVTLLVGRRYYSIFRNSITTHCSDLSAISASTGPLTAKSIPLSNIPFSADPQVDRVLILATADGGDPSTLYLLADLPNGFSSITDNIAEADLLDSEVFLNTDDVGAEHGVADNTPPPNGSFAIRHQGRLFMIKQPYVYFSKNIEELTTSTGLIAGKYEEAWPADYFFDIAAGAETPIALISDGQALYIGSERTIHRLYGNGPLNFQKPDVLFTNVGVANHDVIKSVFLEGAPVGAMWLTPDFRVIGSDFNTYRDVGYPIQDILNSINAAQVSKCQAVFFSDGQFDLFILAVPTGVNTECDTVLVYDLRSKQWVTWKLTDVVTGWLYNIQASGIPQLLFAATSNSNAIYKFDAASTQDQVNVSSTNFTSTIKTPWLHLGDPSVRKLLNEIEIITSDANLTVSVEGASTNAEFLSPLAVLTNAPLVSSPFGEYKVYLATSACKDRFYRFTFTSTGQATDLLDTYNIQVIPFHRL